LVKAEVRGIIRIGRNAYRTTIVNKGFCGFFEVVHEGIAGVTEVTIRNRYKELTEKLGIEVQL